MRRGFYSDDFWLIPARLADVLRHPLEPHGQPLEMLVAAALPADALWQHVANYALFVVCLFLVSRVARKLDLPAWSELFALSAFFHPAFLWSVTWIAPAQRSARAGLRAGHDCCLDNPVEGIGTAARLRGKDAVRIAEPGVRRAARAREAARRGGGNTG